MYILGSQRDKLLDCFPKGGIVAEIGVAQGDFSQKIFDQAMPRCLHLIDPWKHWDDEGYKADPNNVAQAEADLRHEGVCSRFRSYIEAEVIKVHRSTSEEAAADFPDGYFDWIYIDAMHTYEACLNDLRLYAPKVKQEGLICGHDYANHPSALHMNFGVVEAVNEFLSETGYTFFLLTYEPFPTYVIAKSADSPALHGMLGKAVMNCGVVAELKDAEKTPFRQVVAKVGDGSERMFYSFG